MTWEAPVGAVVQTGQNELHGSIDRRVAVACNSGVQHTLQHTHTAAHTAAHTARQWFTGQSKVGPTDHGVVEPDEADERADEVPRAQPLPSYVPRHLHHVARGRVAVRARAW